MAAHYLCHYGTLKRHSLHGGSLSVSLWNTQKARLTGPPCNYYIVCGFLLFSGFKIGYIHTMMKSLFFLPLFIFVSGVFAACPEGFDSSSVKVENLSLLEIRKLSPDVFREMPIAEIRII